MYTQRFVFKNVFRSVGIIFLIVGIVFLAVTFGLVYSSSKFYANAVPAEGQIERISSREIYVSYEADGEEMISPLGFYANTMRVGDPITVYYAADNPAKIRTKGSQLLYLIFGIVGAVMLGTGAALVIYSARKKAQGKLLRETGIRLDGEIIGVAVDSRISSNYQHPYVLQCQCRTPDGQVRLFQSEPIWYNPTNLLTTNHVPIYVDRTNFQKYYVDLLYVLPNHQS